MTSAPPTMTGFGSAEVAAEIPVEREAVLADAPAEQWLHQQGGLPVRSNTPIVLTWLARLRWLALLGQSAALASAWWLSAELPWPAVLGVLSVTAVTNLALTVGVTRQTAVPALLVPGLLLLDIGLLTLLLMATGGHENPFATLYVVHVAMAVFVVSPKWIGAVVVASVLGYGSTFLWHLPLRFQSPPPPWVFEFGRWLGMLIEASLIAYFIVQLAASLRRQQREVAEMRDLTERSERLASLTTLAAGAAHELGTPLGTIAVVAKELEHDLNSRGTRPVSETAIEDAKLIRSQVERCREILDGMNAATASKADETPHRLSPSELLEELKRHLRPLDVERLRPEWSSQVGEVMLPVQAVVRALAILVQNAGDASVQAEAGGPPRAVGLRMSRGSGNSGVVFEVIDQGGGIPEEMLSRLGQPFVTGKAPGQGMGLGLFLVRLLASHLHGRLRVRTRLGSGTSVVLEIPEPQVTEPRGGEEHLTNGAV